MFFKKVLFIMLVLEIMVLSSMNIGAVFEEEDFSPKILLVGDMDVGKTAIWERFFNREFGKSKATLGVNGVLHCEDDIVKMQIFDISGNECYQYSNRVYYGGAHVAIIVFDVRDPTPFVSIIKWMHRVQEKAYNCKFIVVCNKIDLVEEQARNESVKTWAGEYGIPYFETSALLNERVNEPFLIALEQSFKLENVVEPRLPPRRKAHNKTNKVCAVF
jgi:small GTP-binding protein